MLELVGNKIVALQLLQFLPCLTKHSRAPPF